MSEIIANSIFYLGIGVFLILVYQSAILPNIRQALRLDVFHLRDDLRNVVIGGLVRQDSPAFILLHDNLNFIAGNLFRFDLGNIYVVRKNTDAESNKQVKEYLELMEKTTPEIRKIYERSIVVLTKALLFNSLFSFSILAISRFFLIGFSAFVRRPFSIVKEKITGILREEAQIVLFRPNQVARSPKCSCSRNAPICARAKLIGALLLSIEEIVEFFRSVLG